MKTTKVTMGLLLLALASACEAQTPGEQAAAISTAAATAATVPPSPGAASASPDDDARAKRQQAETRLYKELSEFDNVIEIQGYLTNHELISKFEIDGHHIDLWFVGRDKPIGFVHPKL